ncbi:archease [Candidatus Uhrbacteria bacterium]|nr:archease [Candidatus Uhrbacteria bacterium]
MPTQITEAKNAVTISCEAKDTKSAFVEGARALFHVLYDTDHIRDSERVEFAIEAESLPALYHAWLSQLSSRAEGEGLVFSEFSVMSIQKVSARQYVLMGSASGDRAASCPKKKTLQKIRTDTIGCKEANGRSTCSVVVEVKN